MNLFLEVQVLSEKIVLIDRVLEMFNISKMIGIDFMKCRKVRLNVQSDLQDPWNNTFGILQPV